ncbi:MAG: hypothetical protein NDJ92_20500 [Thermoanaerobaculia bacterium]|nr:hypothetical protein [Thermoanaerobaculia bacterium]
MSETNVIEPSPGPRAIDLEESKMSRTMKERVSNLLRKSVGLPERGSSCCGVTSVEEGGSEPRADGARSGMNATAADAREQASCCGTGASSEVARSARARR